MFGRHAASATGRLAQNGLASRLIRLPRTVTLVLLLCVSGAGAQDDALGRAEALADQGSKLEQQARYDEAIALTSEALAIREKALGPDHPDVAKSLNNLAALYVEKGRFAEAEPLYLARSRDHRKGTWRRRPRTSPRSSTPRAISTACRGGTPRPRRWRGRRWRSGKRRSDPRMRRSPGSLNNLASLAFAQGHYAEAETLFQRSLAIWQTTLGPEHPEVANTLSNLAVLYDAEGRYDQAERLYQRSLAIREKALGPEHPDLATTLNNLAEVYAAQARFSEAEPLLKRSLAIREKALGPDHPAVGESLNNLAQLYFSQGRDAEAEPLYKRSLETYEQAVGPDHSDVAMSLSNLAALYVGEGRFELTAEPLLKRSLAIREKALGPDHPDVATALNNLAEVYRSMHRYAEAEALYQRGAVIWQKAFGPEHPDLGRCLNNLAEVYRDEGQYAEAVPLFQRSLAIFEKALGEGHPMVARSLNNLAALYEDEGRDGEAEPLFKRALAIDRKAFGPEHHDIALTLWNLAALYRRQQRIPEARSLAREAAGIVAHRVSVAAGARAAGDGSGEQREFRDLFLMNVALAEPQGGAEPLPIRDSFRMAQLANASSTAKAVAGMAARFAAGSDALAAIVRERQDLAQRWQGLDSAIVQAASKPQQERNSAVEESMRKELTDVDARLDALDARTMREFPAYAELSNPKPLQLAEAQALLAPDEAMLVYLIGRDESWLWALRRDKAEFYKLDIGAVTLSTDVQALRERLDPELNADLLPFDAGRAHALYQKILAPAAPLLDGAKLVFVVPDRALESLPLGVLVTKAPEQNPQDLAEHRDFAWFAREHALAVLPSVGALRELRQYPARALASSPFIGIGDPLLQGKVASARGGKSGSLFRGALADTAAVRSLPSLPETADELRAVAKAMGAGDDDLYLAERATESLLREAGLDRYRVVEFATHGLMSGDLKGLAEPALVLTPPDQPTPDDDGLLTASKIARLKLNAEWVVLSACNTAAGDGTPDADGLSGLAKAFFYAGARSLLVSHWSVPSAATVKLITGTFAELQNNPEIGRAEALHRAEMAMLDPKNPAEFAHPLSWAAFVLAGEGGAGR